MHVIMRYEIEQALVNGTLYVFRMQKRLLLLKPDLLAANLPPHTHTSGSLDVAQVPQEWNRKMKQYLGVEVEGDDKGCLQGQ